jgi:DNA-binding HxlR family transcriptional regulator
MKTIDYTLCPQVEAAFELLAKKWAGLIVFSLGEGEMHFGEFKEAIPALSARVLAQRMRDLEKAGLVERRVSGASPVRVSYGLTKKGGELAAVMRGIADWARNY